MKQGKEAQYRKAIEKERNALKKQEEGLRRSMLGQSAPKWKETARDVIPNSVYANLQKAFRKAFSLIYEKGTVVVEKTYDKKSIQEDHEILAYAFRVKADRKSLRRCRRGAAAVGLRSLAAAGTEGAGLGVLGVGLPDIALFLGVLMRGLYETALHYGFGYEDAAERYFILRLMETALLRGGEWEKSDAQINEMIEGRFARPDAETLAGQLERTADVFAMELLLLKFLQGIPVAGVLGGIGNPVYCHKILKYADMKYYRRYLAQLSEAL